jgi:hypothetical protein
MEEPQYEKIQFCDTEMLGTLVTEGVISGLSKTGWIYGTKR